MLNQVMLSTEGVGGLRIDDADSATQTCSRQAAEGRRKVAHPGDWYAGTSV